jgi:hypothetical protein
VTQGHVTEFVGHHAGHLAFIVRCFDHAAVDVHWPTGQREGVDVSRVDDFEVVIEFGMLKLSRDRIHEPPPYALNVASDGFIVQ